MNIQYVMTNHLFALFFLLISNLSVAADFVFTPATPTVEVGQQITLSVSGTSGYITWSASKGQIQGAGNQVTYIAPAKAGLDVVTAFDSEGNVGIIKIVVTLTQTISLENANWKVFTNRSGISAILLDGETVWVGTSGGLEQREAETGKIKRVFTRLDGLPNNSINALASDGSGGLWIGTDNTDLSSVNNIAVPSGLAHYSDGTWDIFNTQNSELPSSKILSLQVDDSDGVWVGTTRGIAYRHADGTWELFDDEHSELSQMYWATSLHLDGKGGIWMGAWIGTSTLLAHRDADGTWEIFNTDNSELPDSYITSLLPDDKGGIWVGTAELGSQDTSNGLAHLHANGTWEIFKKDNSELPHNDILSLVDDEQGGFWIASDGGLVHRHADGTWEIFSQVNSLLPSDYIFSLSSDGKDGIWIGTLFEGLARRHADGNWDIFNKDHFQSPGNYVTSLLTDANDELWMGTQMNGLAHRQANGTWKIFNWKNSALPGLGVTSLIADGSGGLWIGTVFGGLAHHKNGTWEIFDTINSGLPYQGITSLLVDERGELWVGTGSSPESALFGEVGGGLAHRKTNGEWEIFNEDNSPLPYNDVRSLVADGQGGIWIGTGSIIAPNGGLAHYHIDGKWEIFNQDNSKLPGNWITSLIADGSHGVWVGVGSQLIDDTTTGGGLAHYHDKTWEIFNRDNSELPNNDVKSLLSDDRGGIWVGTRGGLVYRDAENTWEIFNTDNSGLPVNDVRSLIADNDGLWVGTWGSGLTHFGFGQKSILCTEVNAANCESILSKNAAIIIAGGGAHRKNSLWDTTEAISNRIYEVFYNRGFDKSEIYYLSPKSWADFNGDGRNDSITRTEEEGSLTVDDVRAALEWAKTAGKLAQPLYLFFVDHGGPEKLQLAKNTQIKANEFKAILDDYQNSTGNKLVLVIEACHSGSLVEALAAPNRAIISSASANEKAYFVEKQGFTYFFVDNLLRGENLFEAFNSAVSEQDKLRGELSQQISEETNRTINTLFQTPQLDDNNDGIFNANDGQWLKEVNVNGNFVTGDFTLAVESLTTLTRLSVDQAVILKAKASTAVGQVVRVWAIVRPPKINLVLDSNGTPILAFPRFNLSSTEEENVWQTTWNDAVYNGDYEISFYAEDNDGNIASSDKSIIISVTGGVEPPEQANVQIVLEKDRYRPGEPFKAELIENLGWGYDLYAALVTSSGFVTIKNTNQFSPVNEAKRWRGQRIQNSHTTLVDFTLPEGLPTGEYCLYGILSPEREDVVATLALDLWVMEQRCFEVF